MAQPDDNRGDSVFTPRGDGVIVTVRVTPRASRSGVSGVSAGALQVRLNAPPVEGEANRELVECLAAACRVPKRAVTIVSGDRGRLKRVAIAGLSAEEAARRLTPAPRGTG